jgi:hypothetical protein
MLHAQAAKIPEKRAAGPEETRYDMLPVVKICDGEGRSEQSRT